MGESIPVNLPQLGNVQCDECGAPCGIHTGVCETAWRQEYAAASNDWQRELIKRAHREARAQYGLAACDLSKPSIGQGEQST